MVLSIKHVFKVQFMQNFLECCDTVTIVSQEKLMENITGDYSKLHEDNKNYFIYKQDVGIHYIFLAPNERLWTVNIFSICL